MIKRSQGYEKEDSSTTQSLLGLNNLLSGEQHCKRSLWQSRTRILQSSSFESAFFDSSV